MPPTDRPGDGRPPAPETPRDERFTQYTVREDPATGTRLVNIAETPPDAWDEYIGRANPTYGVGESEWANPYRLGDDGDRDTVTEKYRQHLFDYLHDNPDAIERLAALAGQTLACWCVGRDTGWTPCHGDVLLDMLAWLDAVEGQPPAVLSALQSLGATEPTDHDP